MVKVQQVSKHFNGFQALYPTNLEIEEGSFTAILGPSGSGKTTLLRILAGLEMSDTGSVSIGGKVMSDSSEHVFVPPEKRSLGMVFQDFALWPHMTVFDNVAYSLRARGIKKNIKESVLRAIDMVQLGSKEKRYPRQLSGGEQQRVSFARAIVAESHLILLDEPLSALDALLREQMRFELKSLVKNLGLTALYVTHDQNEALSMADRVLVMDKGRILQSGPPEEVYNSPSHLFVASFLGRSNWFGGKSSMIRPEHVSWNPLETDHEVIEGIVEEVGYLGDRYEVLISLNKDHPSIVADHNWTAYRNSPLSKGESVRLYLRSENIKSFP